SGTSQPRWPGRRSLSSYSSSCCREFVLDLPALASNRRSLPETPTRDLFPPGRSVPPAAATTPPPPRGVRTPAPQQSRSSSSSPPVAVELEAALQAFDAA